MSGFRSQRAAKPISVILVVAGVMASAGSVGAKQLTDVTPPTVQQPSDITVAANGPTSADVSFTVNATDPDNPASEISINCSWSSHGKTFPSGTTTQTLSVGTWPMDCYAFDPAGNSSAHVGFTITVTPFVDTTPPVLQVSNQTIPASSAAGTTLFYNVGATDPDDSSASITISCDHNLAGGLFPVGATLVTCNAQDPAGNHAQPTSFTVTVTPLSTTNTTTTTATTTNSTPPADVTGCSNSNCMANYIDFFGLDGCSCDFGSFNWSKTNYTASKPSAGITPPLTIHTGNQTGDVSITFAVNGHPVGVASTRASGQQSGIYYDSVPFNVAQGQNAVTVTVVDPLHHLSARVYTFSFLNDPATPSVTTTATTTTSQSSPAGPSAGSSGSGGPSHSTNSHLPAASVSAPAVRTSSNGKQSMSFSIRLSSAATLQVALLARTGKTVLRFGTHAKTGRAQVSRSIPGHRLTRGSHLILKVTIVGRSERRTITLPITVR
jgi:hypothetical protein